MRAQRGRPARDGVPRRAPEGGRDADAVPPVRRAVPAGRPLARGAHGRGRRRGAVPAARDPARAARAAGRAAQEAQVGVVGRRHAEARAGVDGRGRAEARAPRGPPVEYCTSHQAERPLDLCIAIRLLALDRGIRERRLAVEVDVVVLLHKVARVRARRRLGRRRARRRIVHRHKVALLGRGGVVPHKEGIGGRLGTLHGAALRRRRGVRQAACRVRAGALLAEVGALFRVAPLARAALLAPSRVHERAAQRRVRRARRVHVPARIAMAAGACAQKVHAVRRVVRRRSVRQEAGAGRQHAPARLQRAGAQRAARGVVHERAAVAAAARARARVERADLGALPRAHLPVHTPHLLPERREALLPRLLRARGAPLDDERTTNEVPALRADVRLAIHGRLPRRGGRRVRRHEARLDELGARLVKHERDAVDHDLLARRRLRRLHGRRARRVVHGAVHERHALARAAAHPPALVGAA